MVKDVIAADWSPDGQTIAVVSFNDSAYRLEYPLDKVLYQPKGGLRIPCIAESRSHRLPGSRSTRRH
jgi:hypothetical protein